MGVEYRYDELTYTEVDRLHTDYTTGRATNLDNLDAAVSTRATQAQIISDATPFQGADVAAILADTSAIDARLPSDPADQSAVEAAITASEAEIQGVDDRDLTEVYNLVNTTSNPFRLTTYTTKTSGAVSYVDATWVDLYSSGALSKDTEITGINITNSAGNPVGPTFRITLGDGSTKVFPYGASDPVNSGRLEEFQFPVRIPADQTYKIQIYCTTANLKTATLTELDVIEVG